MTTSSRHLKGAALVAALLGFGASPALAQKAPAKPAAKPAVKKSATTKKPAAKVRPSHTRARADVRSQKAAAAPKKPAGSRSRPAKV